MTGAELFALLQVLLLDIVLSGDNAVIVGAIAAGLAANQRKQAIIFGVGLAVVARIAMALGAVWIMGIPAVVFVGGLLLLWVAFKMGRELMAEASEDEHAQPKSFAGAIFAIAVADISMSLDNVLAVAGASREHPYIMAFGLFLSVVLMGIGATVIAKLMDRFKWIGWVGLVLVLAVAVRMLWHGWPDVAALVA